MLEVCWWEVAVAWHGKSSERLSLYLAPRDIHVLEMRSVVGLLPTGDGPRGRGGL